jgi:hypothetical protein
MSDVRTFGGGMNYDDDERLLPVGDYRSLVNGMDGTPEGYGGAIINIKGTTAITAYPPASGEYICIGTCKDNENGAIVFFMYNTLGYHSIFRLITATGVVEKIREAEPLLNFSKDYRINDANIVGDLLLWTDGYNPPRCINMVMAKNYQTYLDTGSSTFPRYYSFTEQHFDLAKYPPWDCPSVTYGSDTTRNYNNLRGKLFQFATRFIYVDNEKTTWSPWSKVALPQGQEAADGSWVENQHLNNYILVVFDKGTELVTKIELAARDSETGLWYIVDTIANSPIGGTYAYKFYNDKVGAALDQSDQARPFDYVPLLAGTQDVIEKSRLVQGQVTEGYDNVTLDVALAANTEMVQFGAPVVDLLIKPVVYYVGDPGMPVYAFNIFLPTPLPTSTTIFAVRFIIEGGGISTSPLTILGLYTYFPGQTTDDIVTGLVASIHTQVPLGWFNNYLLIHNYYSLGQEVFRIDALQYFYGTTTFSHVSAVLGYYYANYEQTVRSNKEGAYHEFGIVYYDDAMRSGATNTDSDCRLYVPFITETPLVGSNLISTYPRTVVDYQIKHRPPVWATSWQWAHTKSSITNFQRFYIYQDPAEGTGISVDPLSGKLRIKINLGIINWLEKTRKKNASIKTYSFTPGDRIRFIGNMDDPGTQLKLFGAYLDYEVLDYDADGDWIYVEYFAFGTYHIGYTPPTTSPSVPGTYTVVEIYTPRKELSEKIFYEVGEVFPVGDPGLATRYHKGLYTWQDPNDPSGIPATGILEGDVYIKRRFGLTPATFPVESSHFSDFYPSDMNTGRVNIQIKDMRQLTLNSLRWSNMYVDNTKTNGLSHFDVLDYLPLNDKHGTVMCIRDNGESLEILQDSHVSSIFVGRQGLKQATINNVDLVTSSQDVLGTVNPLKGELGCQNPESVVMVDGNMYWWDNRNAVYVRKASNGMFPISWYKMDSYFNKIPALFAGKSTFWAVGGYDPYQQNVVISFQELDPTTNESVQGYTLGFNERSNRWKAFYDYYKDSGGNFYTPDVFAEYGRTMYAIVKGEIYSHNTSATRGNFYGTAHGQVIEVVSNEEPLKIKVFRSITVNANKLWSADNTGDVAIKANDTYKRGMLSRIKAGRFTKREGYWWAEFLRNMLTKGILPSPIDLISGDLLKGQSIKVKLQNSETDEVVLFSIVINSI